MTPEDLDQKLARWRVEPAASDEVARAVPAPGRPDPLMLLPATCGVVFLLGAAVAWQANNKDAAEMLDQHARELVAALHG